MALELYRLETLAAALCGQPVAVRFEGLRFLGLVGAVKREPDGTRAILLDERLANDPEELSFTFYHEAAHIHRGDRGVTDAVERMADATATVAGIRIGRTAPWRLANSDTAASEREGIMQRANAYAATLRSGRAYTVDALEAEYRSGALDRTRQTQRGTVESMIARSLGLPHGEGNRVEWATAGGYVRVAAR